MREALDLQLSMGGCCAAGSMRRLLSLRSLRRALCGCCSVLLTLSLLSSGGCAGPQADPSAPGQPTAAPAGPAAEHPPATLPAGFGPVKISILPLTELVAPAGPGAEGGLDVYLALLDAFGSQIKAPGTVRFELYEYVPRSAEPKGPRIVIWPDFDLTRPAENNQHWRDFLRAYEFQLGIRVDQTKPHVLEATCVGPDGKRLSAEYTLKTGE